MNIKELKEAIKDLPDEMLVGFTCRQCEMEYGQSNDPMTDHLHFQINEDNPTGEKIFELYDDYE